MPDWLKRVRTEHAVCHWDLPNIVDAIYCYSIHFRKGRNKMELFTMGRSPHSRKFTAYIAPQCGIYLFIDTGDRGLLGLTHDLCHDLSSLCWRHMPSLSNNNKHLDSLFQPSKNILVLGGIYSNQGPFSLKLYSCVQSPSKIICNNQ